MDMVSSLYNSACNTNAVYFGFVCAGLVRACSTNMIFIQSFTEVGYALNMYDVEISLKLCRC